jgi:hypothetical protein
MSIDFCENLKNKYKDKITDYNSLPDDEEQLISIYLYLYNLSDDSTKNELDEIFNFLKKTYILKELNELEKDIESIDHDLSYQITKKKIDTLEENKKKAFKEMGDMLDKKIATLKEKTGGNKTGNKKRGGNTGNKKRGGNKMGDKKCIIS